MSSRFIQFFFFCIVASLVTACAATTYKLYEGTNLTQEKIAILTNSDLDQIYSSLVNVYDIYIDLVDGKKPPDARWNKSFYGSKFGGGYRIELLPGKHTLSVRLGSPNKAGYYSLNNIEITFDAEAGKKYVVLASMLSQTTWKAWVVEIRGNHK
jgi:hypothetical protein